MTDYRKTCRLDLEDREMLAKLKRIPRAFRYFARPASVDVQWHHTENQGQMGSCFPAKTTVLSGTGETVWITDISVGDTVFTHLDHKCEVLDTPSRKYTGDLITVSVEGGANVTSTQDHMFRTTKGWTRADALTTEMELIMVGSNLEFGQKKVRELNAVAVKDEQVYCLTVDKDHSFIANEFAVHNCQGNDLSSVAERIVYVTRKKTIQLSRIFAYLATQKIDGLLGSDQGSTISGGAKLLTTVGLPLESLTGYPSSYPIRRDRDNILSQANYEAAAENMAASMWACPPDPDEAKNWIGGGGGISLGIRWPGMPNNRIMTSYRGGSGGHAIAILGYDCYPGCKDPHLVAVNSWGDGPFAITNTCWTQMLNASYTAAIGLAGAENPEPESVVYNFSWK